METKVVVVMTNSIDPEDQKRSEGNDVVNGFVCKPLSRETLTGIITEHLPGHI